MITYREAVKKDIPSLLKLYEQLNPEDTSLDLSMANNIWDKIEKSETKYFIALDHEKIIASCFISIIPNLTRNGQPIGFIENVITDTTYRRKGLGKKVMDMAIEYAKSNNCYKVLLQSNNKRKEAHLFYESIGFNGDSKKAFELRLTD